MNKKAALTAAFLFILKVRIRQSLQIGTHKTRQLPSWRTLEYCPIFYFRQD